MLCCRWNLAALVHIVCHPPWRNYVGRNAQIEKVASAARMYIVPHRPTFHVVAYVRGRTRRRCTSCRSERLTLLSTPMQQVDSIRGLLRCSRSAAIRILLACLPSATVLIMPLSYQRRACLEKHERHRILCYDTGLVVCEENPDPMLHNSMYLCM